MKLVCVVVYDFSCKSRRKFRTNFSVCESVDRLYVSKFLLVTKFLFLKYKLQQLFAEKTAETFSDRSNAWNGTRFCCLFYNKIS